MQPEPERIEIVYLVRYFDPVRKKRFTTRYKMTEEIAKDRFGDSDYEIIQSSREERKVGGDPMRNSAAHFHTGTPGD